MFEELNPATYPHTGARLTQATWAKLYHAINEMLVILGAEGEIDSRHSTVFDVMAALRDIDGGEYQVDFGK